MGCYAHRISPCPWKTQLFALSVKLYDKSYSYLPPGAFDIRIKECNIVTFLQPKNMFGNLLYVSLFALQTVLGFVVLAKFVTSRSSRSLDSFELVQIGISVLFWDLFISILIRGESFKDAKHREIAINQLLQGSKQHLTKSIFVDYCGWLLVYLNLGMIFLGTPTPFVAGYINIDLWHMIFAEFGFVTGDSYLLTILSNILSVVLFILGARDFMVFMPLAFGIILSIEGHLMSMYAYNPRNQKDQSVYMAYYHLQTLYSVIRELYNKWIMYTILFSQIVLTVLIWMAVNCVAILPWFIVLMCGAAFVGGLVLVGYFLNYLASVRNVSQKIVSDCRNSGRRMKTSEDAKYIRRIWMAQQAMSISCGSHFSVTKDAVLNFLDVLNANVTNALILIKI